MFLRVVIYFVFRLSLFSASLYHYSVFRFVRILNAGIPFVFKFVRVSVCWYIFCVQICACFSVLVYLLCSDLCVF